LGPVASFFVKSSYSGAGQCCVLFNTYPRPIPSAGKSYVPRVKPASSATGRNAMAVKVLYPHRIRAHEQNEASTTVALMKIGGRSFKGTAASMART